MSKGSTAASHGIGMGTAAAMILSYTTHGSVLWMLVNGFFSWFYVIYWIFKYGVMAQ